MGFVARTAAAALITVITFKVVNHIESKIKSGEIKLPSCKK